MQTSNIALTPAQFEQKVSEGYVILDTRNREDYFKGFVKGSYSLDLSTTFALWVGKLITPDNKFVIVCAQGKELEVITRLARIGYDNVAGFLEGGVENWKNSGKNLESMKSYKNQEFVEIYKKDKTIQVLDVREIGE